MRTSDKKVNKILKNQVYTLFSQTIADIKNISEADQFLNDFFTPSEKETFAKRMAISYWLKKGRSYGNIKDNLKVSSATISSVQSIVNKKGVQNALKKIEAEEWASQWSDRIKKVIGN